MRYIFRFVAALWVVALLGGCGAMTTLQSDAPRTDTPVEELGSGDGFRAFAWTDRRTGCQYITTHYFTNAVHTLPRLGTKCAPAQQPAVAPGQP